MDPSSREFVKHVRSHLHEHDFRLVMGRGRTLNCGMGRCSGYYDSESKEIRVARGHPDMIATLRTEHADLSEAALGITEFLLNVIARMRTVEAARVY